MYVASRLPITTDVSGWVHMLPARHPNLPLTETITADIAIIGGGFAGLSAARRLSLLDPSLRVVVLEAGVIGEGAAGRNSGFIIDLPHEVSSDDFGKSSNERALRDITLYRTAIELAATMAQEQGWGKDIYDPCGRYSVAISGQGDDHIKSYASQLDGLNEPYTLLDAKEIVGVTGCSTYTSGLYMPGTVMIQPAAYIRSIADSFKAPIRVLENTPALSFEKASGGWSIKTPKGRVNAGKIILANNGHAESFGFFKGNLLHIFTYASMTEPFDPKRLAGQRDWAATPALPMGTTVRRISGKDGDRVLIRSRYTYHSKPQVSDATVQRAGRVHDHKFADRFPSLNGVAMQYRWGGPMALTRNSVPAFGEVDQGVIAACACNGLGASKSTAAGIAAAEVALGVKTAMTEIFSQYANPVSLPPQPFLSIGAKANLRYKEWQAGRE
ncbi:NAD(P)/FAD-dependent oxidoreductase [Pseudomonas sp. NA-150]|uniref:NAD(P)/FAD-dependent oxidoreductase n=1 Tax=Pseudomonas sp. NA-150 TaxID=3367525 RepID=UPI0037C5B1D0